MSAGKRNPFALIAALANKRNVRDIGKLPGCWEVELRDGWSFAVNGHDSDVRCSKGADVPPFNAYVEWQGTPAGIINHQGGPFLGGDDGADAFCDALDAAIAEEPQP